MKMEEINDVVQIINLGAKGMAFALKGAKATGRLTKKGIDAASLAILQHKIKVHYAAQGKHDTLTVKSLEKITGGDYRIMNIPTEDGTELIKFYDALKKIKVPFAELPDLNLGDGYTQVAYNPQDADKIKSFCQNYVFSDNKEAKETNMEEYIKTSDPKLMDELTENAVKAAATEDHTPSPSKSEEKAELEELKKIEKMRERNSSPEWIPLTINKNNVIEETELTYITRVPSSYNHENGDYLILPVAKSVTSKIDNGKTLVTHIPKDKLLQLSTLRGDIVDITGKDLFEQYYNNDRYRNGFEKKEQNRDIRFNRKKEITNKVKM